MTDKELPVWSVGEAGTSGDFGPRGPQGLTGPQGIRGIKGHRGDRGDKITQAQKIELHKRKILGEIIKLQKGFGWAANYNKIKQLKKELNNHKEFFPEYYL